MAIEQYLDLSTAHVKRETMNPVAGHYLIAEYEQGAFFYVPACEDIAANASPDLAAVLEYARTKGCTLVRLDADGDVIDDLPVFDW